MIPQSLEIPVRRGYLILFALEHLVKRRPQVERCFVRRRDVPEKAEKLPLEVVQEDRNAAAQG